MRKKDKKVFKPRLKLSPKVVLNRKRNSWRRAEMKNRYAGAISELRLLAMKSMFTDQQSYKELYNIRARLSHKLADLNKRASVYKNYCHYIGRARSVSRKLYMSRHMLRKFARFGMLPGFVKERC